MNVFVFSPPAKKTFEHLELDIQHRIKTKLQFLKEHPDIFCVILPLAHFPPATHKLRVGDYRLILEKVADERFLVLDIGHRREIYK
ncbi:type II toxin-antitoxin system RelE/ParE family toxin [Candidatus Gracilibacteria bacterium]|nr:type II toxin-antitoxin system RelE/ParE family toxin [Candidatus Gracilibacteria bacterium]